MLKFLRRLFMSDEKKVGRPRLPDPNESYVEPVLPKQASGKLTDTAFGLAKLPDGKSAIVKIQYNPLTGETGLVEVGKSYDAANDAEYDFRDAIDAYLIG